MIFHDRSVYMAAICLSVQLLGEKRTCTELQIDIKKKKKTEGLFRPYTDRQADKAKSPQLILMIICI